MTSPSESSNDINLPCSLTMWDTALGAKGTLEGLRNMPESQKFLWHQPVCTTNQIKLKN